MKTGVSLPAREWKNDVIEWYDQGLNQFRFRIWTNSYPLDSIWTLKEVTDQIPR